MSYGRFAAMIATSTVVMFGLMYLNTYVTAHVLFSQTRMWMALLMGATMAAIMMAFMWGMYPYRRANLLILGGSVLVFGGALFLKASADMVVAIRADAADLYRETADDEKSPNGSFVTYDGPFVTYDAVDARPSS